MKLASHTMIVLVGGSRSEHSTTNTLSMAIGPDLVLPYDYYSLTWKKCRDAQQQGWLLMKVWHSSAQEHARKVAKELGATSGLIYLPGQESKNYEDSDQPPEFRQRR